MSDSITPAEAVCLRLAEGPGELCVLFPGGAKICASYDVEFGDSASIIRGYLGQINTGLAGLAPFFTMLDVIVAIVDCVKAVKDAIGPPPNPTKLVKCMPNLLTALDKLLELHPAISIPKTVKGILRVIIVGLRGLRSELEAFIMQAARVTWAETRGAALGNVDLIVAADCARNQFGIELANLNASMTPLRRLFGVLNALLKLAGAPCIQVPLDAIETATEAAFIPIDAAIAAVQYAYDAIPIPDLPFPAIPGSQEPC